MSVTNVNKHHYNNLTNVHWFDASAGTYSPNLLNGNPPYALLPPAPAVGDIVYFGCDVTLLNAGPFSNVTLNLIGGSAGLTVVWEYWTGVWAAFNMLLAIDNTNSFKASGVVTFSFDTMQIAAWIAANPGLGVTGWFVRARVTAWAAGALPIQIVEHVHSTVWPFFATNDASIPGDIDAPVLQDILAVADNSSRIFFADRSISRGADFTPYLNLSDTQQPANVDAGKFGASTAWAADVRTPSGRILNYAPGGVVEENICRVAIQPVLANQYLGRYHAFVRGTRINFLDRLQLQLQVALGSTGNVIFTTNWINYYSSTGANIAVINDMGQLFIELADPTYGLDILYIILRAKVSAACSVGLFDIVLLPADEMVVDISFIADVDRNNPSSSTNLIVDSILSPKETRRAKELSLAGVLQNLYRFNGRTSLMLPSNKAARLWFLGASYNIVGTTVNAMTRTDGYLAPNPHFLARYLSMRGDR